MTEELKPCPFCGEYPRFQLCDAEGNFHGDSYIDDPWSGISYAITHNNVGCPIDTHEGEAVGNWLYDTLDDAIAAWNRRKGETDNAPRKTT